MSHAGWSRLTLAAAVVVAAIGLRGWTMEAQAPAAVAQVATAMPPMPVNDGVGNPYETIEGFFKLPEGRTWGSTSAVDIDKDGKTIWVGERCGTNSCNGSKLDPILHFDQNGKLLKSFGSGMIIFPHGIHVDRDGNIWVTDGQDNGAAARGGGAGGGGAAAPAGRGAGGRGGAADQAPAGTGAAAPAGAAPAAGGAGGGRGGRGGGGAAGGGAAAGGAQAAGGGRGTGAPPAPNPNATIGHQVFKFSPDGKLLMTIGKAGGATGPTECCWQPNDVITNAAGEIFISEGHGTNPNDRILKYSKDGKLIKTWGKRGAGPGEFNQPHALAFDSKGRLFVGDRANNRTQIFDQEGTFIADWPQFSRPSGLFIDKNDMLYSADSESGGVSAPHGWWKRGIRIGSVKDGVVTAFIPDPSGQYSTFAMVDVNGTPTARMIGIDGKPAPGGTLAAEGVAVDNQGNIYGAEVGPRKLQKYVLKKK